MLLSKTYLMENVFQGDETSKVVEIKCHYDSEPERNIYRIYVNLQLDYEEHDYRENINTLNDIVEALHNLKRDLSNERQKILTETTSEAPEGG